MWHWFSTLSSCASRKPWHSEARRMTHLLSQTKPLPVIWEQHEQAGDCLSDLSSTVLCGLSILTGSQATMVSWYLYFLQLGADAGLSHTAIAKGNRSPGVCKQLAAFKRNFIKSGGEGKSQLCFYRPVYCSESTKQGFRVLLLCQFVTLLYSWFSSPSFIKGED